MTVERVVLLGAAVLLVIAAAALLVDGMGPDALWFAVIAVGIAVVVILQRKGTTGSRHH